MDFGSLQRFLPWGRSQPASDGSAPAAASTVSVERSGVPAWRRAPALVPTVGPAPLIARTRGYEQELAGGRGTRLALQRLTHERGLDAPRGLVSAVSAPVSRTPAEPMPTSARRGRVHRTPATGTAAGAAHPHWSVADDSASAGGHLPAIDAASGLTWAGSSSSGGSSSGSSSSGSSSSGDGPVAGASAVSAITTDSSTGSASPIATEPSQYHSPPTPQLPAPTLARRIETAPSLMRSTKVDDRPIGIVGERAVGAAQSGDGVARARDSLARSTGVAASTSVAAETTRSPDTSPGSPGVVGLGTSSGYAATARTPLVSRSVASPADGHAARTGGIEPAGSTPPTTPAPMRARRVRFGTPLDPSTRSIEPAGSTAAVARQADSLAVRPDDPFAADPFAMAHATSLDPTASADPAGHADPPAQADSTAHLAPAASAASRTLTTATSSPAVAIRPLTVARVTDEAAGQLVGTLRPGIDLSSPAVAVRRPPEAAADDDEPEPGSPSAALAALSRIDPYGAFGGTPTTGFTPGSGGPSGFRPGAGPAAQRTLAGGVAGPSASVFARGSNPAGTGALSHAPGSPGQVRSTQTGPTQTGSGADASWFAPTEPLGLSSGSPTRPTSRGGQPLPSSFGGRPTVLRLAAAARSVSVGNTSTSRLGSSSVGPGGGFRALAPIGSVKSARAATEWLPARADDSGDGAQSSSAQGGYPSVQGSFAGAGATPLTSWSGSPEQGGAGSFDDGNAFGGIIGRSIQAAPELPLPGVQRADDGGAAAADAGAAGSAHPAPAPRPASSMSWPGSCTNPCVAAFSASSPWIASATAAS